MAAFGLALAAGINTQTKLNSLTEDIDTVLFIADDEGRIQALHSPRNFDGTRTRKTNKVGCLVGFGSQAMTVLLSKSQSTGDCNIVTPKIEDTSNCATKEQIEALVCPDQDSTTVTFLGSNTFIPAP